MEAKTKLESLLDSQLELTGAEIPEGAHPVILFEFGEPWEMDATKSKFRKPNDPPTKTVFELSYGVIDKNGNLARMEQLLPWPDGGATNRKSKLYATLKALSVGIPGLMDANGNYARGTTLKSFIGAKGIANVKKNADNDFTKIESVIAPMDGLKYPDIEACKKLPKSDGTVDSHIPF